MIFQLIDDHSRYAVASHVASGETAKDAIAVFDKAVFDHIDNTQRPHQGLPGRSTPLAAWEATSTADPPRPKPDRPVYQPPAPALASPTEAARRPTRRHARHNGEHRRHHPR